MTLQIGITVFTFLATMLVIFWRPRGLNEAVPAAVGAAVILFTGTVSGTDVADIIDKIGGAAITIMATIVMAVILESFGFFHWAAAKLASLARGSGYRLYWYIQLLCFLMTLLFNNDGSILITTPILILLLKNLSLPTQQQIPYLLSGALIATASSAPIGVSNIVNLIALEIIDMSLYMHTAMMFVPATLGLLFMSWLMFIVVKKKLPTSLPASATDIEETFFTKHFKPIHGRKIFTDTKQKRTRFMLMLLLFVFLIRCLLFVASYLSIPISAVAVIGSLWLLAWRWYCYKQIQSTLSKKHHGIFSFSPFLCMSSFTD